MRLSESTDKEVMFNGTTSTAACNDSHDDRLMSQENTDGKITYISCELLECILLKLSYHEISRVRQVCQRFRDVGNGILNREFLHLKKYAESQLDAVVKEENTLPLKTLQKAMGSTERAENRSTGPEAPVLKDTSSLSQTAQNGLQPNPPSEGYKLPTPLPQRCASKYSLFQGLLRRESHR
jgi:hypothetical protein